MLLSLLDKQLEGTGFKPHDIGTSIRHRQSQDRGVELCRGGELVGANYNVSGKAISVTHVISSLFCRAAQVYVTFLGSNGAGAAFRSRDLGTIEKGKIADLVVFEADPLADIHNIEKISTVVAQGRVVDLASLPEHPIFFRKP
jgi:imidazolonepropionase-like amidohydrolase